MPYIPGTYTKVNNKGYIPGSYIGSKGGGYIPGAIRIKKADLTTSEGLLSVAQQKGGTILDKANDIITKSKESAKKGLIKTLDIISRPMYASASAVKNVIDNDANTTFTGGLKSGITGETKFTYSDVLEEGGWKPESKGGKIAKGVAGFALDVLLDPTTYITFGAGAGVKVAVGGTTKVLTKGGAELLAKGVAQKALTEAEINIVREGVTKASTVAEKKLYDNAVAKMSMDSSEMVKTAIGNMAEKSPELYKKFIDQGGIKFFGQTLISSGAIKGVVDIIPGMSKLDELTAPIRNKFGALFNRDVSSKYGDINKIGQVGDTGTTGREFIAFKNKMNDLSKVKTTEALDEIINIARENKLTANEATIITDSIQAGVHINDPRLENSRKLFEKVMGRNLADEQRVGIKIGELKNYVAQMLLETKKPNFKFNPAKSGGRKEFNYTLKSGEVVKINTPGAQTMKEIRDSFGEDVWDPNIINTAAVRSVASARIIAKQEFVNGVKAFGALADNAPTNFVEVATKGLEGMKFHPAVAEQIEKMSKAFISDAPTRDLMAAFDKVQGLWKASVTSIFPAFHGRNAISNVFLNFLDIGTAAISPGKHMLATGLLNDNRLASNLEKQILRGGEVAITAKKQLDTILNKTILTDDFGKKWSFKDLRDEMKNRRVAFGDEFTGSMDVRQTIKDKLAGKVSGVKKTFGQKIAPVNIFSQENVAVKSGKALGNLIEQQARALNFLTNLQKTGDVTTAAERTKQFLFDYTNLSDFEKNVMRRLIPFYTFCLPDYSLILTKTGWKTCDDLVIDEEVLTYNVDKDIYEWQPAKEIHIFNYNNELTSLSNTRHKILFTPDHRWVTETLDQVVKRPYGEYFYKGKRKIKRGYELNTQDRIKVVSEIGDEKESLLTPKQATLLGWLLTDGYFRWKGNYCEAMIYQSPKKWTYKYAIEAAGGREQTYFHPDTGVARIAVIKELIEELKPYLNRSKIKDDWVDVVTSLSKEAAQAMYDAMYMADGVTVGHRTQDSFACQLDGVGKTFEVLATLLGKRVVKNSKGFYVSHKQNLKISDCEQKTVNYLGRVWCPTTVNGTWVTKQGNLITITGNTRKNLELQVTQLLKQPGKLATQAKLFGTISKLASGGSLTEDEMQNLPTYLQDGLGIVWSRDGDKVEIISTIGTPIESIFTALKDNSLLGSMSPVISVPLQAAIGKHFFFERNMEDVNDATAFKGSPEWLKKYIGFTIRKNKDGTDRYIALNPTRLFIISNIPPFTRTIQTVGQLENENVSGTLKMLRLSTGLKPYGVNLSEQAAYKEKARVRELQDLLDKAGVAPIMKRSFIPKQ